ncbi:peptide chain release factor N(5)-glutamine methyltransferase [Psychrobacter sp. F1192]|uniref:Release factor glutamine methyltransferase n=1 Tax=Psychrobacter coccoides TaxID=2818440 RepID=A0ABS3NPQ4_9GAMM|nr:peptide chain release factor N(5)-glutamine methyltransferase [Psychrobacter coccoides]MBO1531073.1 peptide chain release factor N(5)-glutamine methyltransferase [Psychrobacter coccoides]
MAKFSIGQVKQQIQQLTNEATESMLPSFWLTDWLLYVIDQPAIFLITDDDYQLTDDELTRFHAGVAKMQQGIPLAYLTGQQDFWSLTFKVNTHTLIPRPDTEVLVEQVLQWIAADASVKSSQLDKANNAAIKHTDTRKRLLDLGTGSGCIAISLAHELKKADWQVVAVDISSEALKVAKQNAIKNDVADIEFIQGSWYDALPSHSVAPFDVIVSNPPYIDEADTHLSRLRAEPISALSAPKHGLADIVRIAQQAKQYLRTDGLLALEHGFDQGAAVRQILSDYGLVSVQTIQDYGNNDRVTLGQKPQENAN